METKTKTIISLGIVAIITIAVASLILLRSNSKGPDASVNGNKVNIKAPGTSVDVNGNDVNIKSQGASINVGSGSSEKEAIANTEEIKRKSNTVLVFDASGSMAEKINGKSKLEIAKESTANFVTELNKEQGNYLGIVAYGHKGSNSAKDKAVSCAGIEELYRMDLIKPDVINSKINPLTANGWTPISDSLEKAKSILMRENSEGIKNSVILVSDGEETCGGDPIKKAKELCDSNIKVVTNVIGFNVSGAQESQLKAIASAGCGTYYKANSKQELDNAFVKISGGSVDVNDGSGSSVHVDDSSVNVNAPGADVKVDQNGVKINVPGVNIDL